MDSLIEISVTSASTLHSQCQGCPDLFAGHHAHHHAHQEERRQHQEKVYRDHVSIAFQVKLSL